MNIDNWEQLKYCPPAVLNNLGITKEIEEKFNSIISVGTKNNIHVSFDNLYYDDQLLSWSHPIVYFDKETNFEFRFTAFQGDWSDDSQLKRFAVSYRNHKEQMLFTGNVVPLFS